MKLSLKLIVLFSALMLLVTASIGIYAIVGMSSQVAHIAEKKLVSSESMAAALINEKYPGDWGIKDGKLFKGNTQIDGNDKVVESIGRLTGDTIAIYKGNMSVAMSSDSQRNEKGSMDKLEMELEKTVLVQGKSYVGQSNGSNEMVLYEPIKNKKGQVIGAFHIGMDKEMYDYASKNFRKNMLLFAVAGLLIAITLSAYLSLRLVRPLVQITRVVEQVSTGQLLVDELSVTSKDELGKLGQAVNEMVRSLRKLIMKVQRTSEQVTGASDSVSRHTIHISQSASQADTTIRQVAAGAGNQAHGTDESAKAVEEIAQSIQHIAETSSHVAYASGEMVQEAEQGNRSVQTAIAEINQLNVSAHQVANKIAELNQNSDSIGSIATVISNISAQTNLLALNAAIEAARAGEQGRGFMIVAGEVKKLAEQSERSAKEITSLIQTVQGATQEAVSAMSTGLEQSERGVRVIQQVGEAFERILESARFVASRNQEVSAVTQEISAGTEEISASILIVAGIAKDTLTNVQIIVDASQSQVHSTSEITSAAESMLHSVEEMKKAISQFYV
ncbi:methyl-accepting chemotaxis protein [Paenibacillus sp. BR2-3]|uniref:methyl-accepting chemotaxis protein n=1 Tax=Paenibacillus sp. BR2-3 TaxID=3048494 RepID=UPI0039777EBD